MASMGNGGVSLNNGSSGGKVDFGGVKTHSSGYKWSAKEDEPGYSWGSKKAQDEYKRAADQMVHKDFGVRCEYDGMRYIEDGRNLTFCVAAKYGDLFEMVENERAVLASMQQR